MSSAQHECSLLVRLYSPTQAHKPVVLWVRVDVNNMRASCPAWASQENGYQVLTCDLHRQQRGIRIWSGASRKKQKKKKAKKRECCCNSWTTRALRFVFMWFQAANPDQTVILIRDKQPSSTFKYLCSQLLSMTDRQRHVRQPSFCIMFSFALYLHKHCRSRVLFTVWAHLFIYFYDVAPWQAYGEVILGIGEYF